MRLAWKPVSRPLLLQAHLALLAAAAVGFWLSSADVMSNPSEEIRDLVAVNLLQRASEEYFHANTYEQGQELNAKYGDEIAMAVIRVLKLPEARAKALFLVGRTNLPQVDLSDIPPVFRPIQLDPLKPLKPISERLPGFSFVQHRLAAMSWLNQFTRTDEMKKRMRAAVPVLVDLTSSEDQETASQALQILTDLGRVAVAAKPRLMEMFDTQDTRLKSAIIRYLESLYPEEPEYRIILMRCFESQDRLEHELAWSFIWKSGNVRPELATVYLAAITNILSRDDHAEIIGALRMLEGNYLLQHADARTRRLIIERTENCLAHNLVELRFWAARSIAVVREPISPEAMLTLRRMMHTDVFLNRIAAAWALETTSGRSGLREAVARDCLNDPSEEVRQRAARILKTAERKNGVRLDGNEAPVPPL
jgi:hypothetical protein